MKSTDELLDFRAPDRGVVPTFGLDIEQVEPELVFLDDAIDTAIPSLADCSTCIRQ